MRREYVLHALLFCAVYSASMIYFYRTDRLAAGSADSASSVTDGALSATVATRQSFPSVQPNDGERPARTTPATRNAGVTSIEPVAAASMAIDYASPQATFTSLEQTALSDERFENRVAAVQSLLQLATNGDADGKIREALRIAATDMDNRVAEAAREALSVAADWTTSQR